MELTREILISIIDRKKAGERVNSILADMGIPYSLYLDLRSEYPEDCKGEPVSSQKFSDEFIQSIVDEAEEKDLSISEVCRGKGVRPQSIFPRIHKLPYYKDVLEEKQRSLQERKHAYELRRINERRKKGIFDELPDWVKNECVELDESNILIQTNSEDLSYPGEMEDIRNKLKKGCNHCVHRNFCANDENFACCAYLPDIRTYLKQK